MPTAETNNRPTYSTLYGPLLLILLIGAAVRIALLGQHHFHPDEALFATLGRLIIQGIDPLLVHTPLLVDKPPLFYYVLAAGIAIDWLSEMTPRLPALYASIVSIALTARIAHELWPGTKASIIASLFVALSPFSILLAPTVFADSLMVMWFLAGLLLALRRRWFLAGIFSGLALATKQNALFLLPLILSLGWLKICCAATRADRTKYILRYFAGLGLMAIAIFSWDYWRLELGAASFWRAGVGFNNPGRLARSDEVWTRLRSWLNLYRDISGYGVTGLVSIATLSVIGAIAPAENPDSPEQPAAVIILAYLVGYACWYWLVAFPLFDRYLLPVVSLSALLLARGVAFLTQLIVRNAYVGRHTSGAWVLSGMLFALMLFPAYQATQYRYDIGGNRTLYEGIDEVASFLDETPVGTVVYYDMLGWTLHYYLFDSDVFLAPFSDTHWLEHDLLANGDNGSARYIVLPAWQSQVEVLDAVMAANYQADPVLQTVNEGGNSTFIVYHVNAIE